MPGRRTSFGSYIDNRLAVALDDYPPSNLLDAAVTCEDLGYDSLWVGDSWLAKPRFEPITTLAAVVVKTHDIKLGTSILQPHLRNPVWLALTWATLDVLSSGRTILGVGLGAGPPSLVRKEYEVAGVPRSKRLGVFVESIEVLKKLWTDGEVDYSGTHFQLKGISLGYKPLQKPHPPIWIAAGEYVAEKPMTGPLSEYWSPKKAGTFYAPFEPVARLGDGWWTAACTVTEYQGAWERIDELARSFGRRPEDIHRALCTWINIDPDPQRARGEGTLVLEKYHNMPMDTGTVDRCCFGTPEYCIK